MIKVLTTDLFASATLAASSTASGFSSANVQAMPISKSWRSSSITSQYLKFDLGSAKEIDLFSIHKNNLTSNATVKLYGHSSDLGNDVADWISTATFNTGNALTFDEIVGTLFLSSAQTLRYWFLELSDASNTDGYLEIGRVFAGKASSTDENFNENFSVEWLDNSRIYESEGGSKYSVQKVRPKIFDITFSDIDSDNVDVIEGWWMTCFKTDPLFIALDSTGEPLSFSRLCQIENDLSWFYGPNNRATTTLRLKELK